MRVQNSCFCDTGWTSRTDFELGYHYDCSINIKAVIILASFDLSVCSLALLYVLRNMMISRFGSKLGFKHLKFRICLAITIFFIGCILFNTPKIIDPVLYVIGPDSPMSTIGWSLMIIGCFSACSYFTMAVCDILKGYRARDGESVFMGVPGLGSGHSLPPHPHCGLGSP